RKARIFGAPGREIPHDEASVTLAVDSLARGMDPTAAPAGFTVELAFRDAPRWHLVNADGAVTPHAGGAPGRADVRLRARYADLVEVMAGNLPPARALLRGGLIPLGRPGDLRRLGTMLGA
ncbi:MAG TPA: SCP2 sterol-binding domain-containing protein, partial [Solirubrobacteraceae bacterium]